MTSALGVAANGARHVLRADAVCSGLRPPAVTFPEKVCGNPL